MEYEKLKTIVAEVLGVDPQEITLESRFVTEFGADSLDIYQIVVRIEKEFDIVIEAGEIEQITTVGEALNLIQTSFSK